MSLVTLNFITATCYVFGIPLALVAITVLHYTLSVETHVQVIGKTLKWHTPLRIVLLLEFVGFIHSCGVHHAAVAEFLGGVPIDSTVMWWIDAVMAGFSVLTAATLWAMFWTYAYLAYKER